MFFSMFELSKSRRLASLPPYLFEEMDRRKEEARRAGRDIIDLGVGDPIEGPLPEIVEALARASSRPDVHGYSTAGTRELREAIAAWFERRFGVRLDPWEEVVPLIGSKEGLAHLPLALADPGDRVLVPDPGYPVYRSATSFAGAEPVRWPLDPGAGFLPDLDAGEKARAKLAFLNYPNNPTSATAGADFYAKAVTFARRTGTLLVNDAAYSEVTFDGYRAPSLLATDGAREVAVEIHSLSKTFHMTGWRVGFAAGARRAIAALREFKANVDSGIFKPIQFAAAEALSLHYERAATAVRGYYLLRRDRAVEGLRRAGCPIEPPKATFFLWAPVPAGTGSLAFAGRLLDEEGVVVAPGVGFGPGGEGYVRLSMTNSVEAIEEAVARIARMAPWK
jgi:LL-diaminopimelate aminotransferase